MSEADDVNATASALILASCVAFGPGRESLAIASLCVALGQMFGMLTTITEFYQTPHQFAEACRKMILDVTLATDEDDET
jgi:hypothetical protein